MSSKMLLLVILVNGVLGTFPPLEFRPPIPGQAVRTRDISPQYYVQEDLNQEIPQPSVENGPFLPDKQDEQRWYIEENPSGQSAESFSSIEGFDRYYPNGELAIGPVATPVPDGAYVAQPSSISAANPGDSTNPGPSDVWIVTRGSDNQYAPERWISVPTDRAVDVVNPEPNPPLATDIVKSIANPLPEIPVQRQYFSEDTGAIVQRILIRNPSISQKGLQNQVTVVEEVPSVKQEVSIQQPNFKQLVQQQITTDSFQFPSLSQLNASPPYIVSNKPFSVPPPPPPPIKGESTSPKVISSFPVGVAPASNVLISGKSDSLQQVRHIWIPTSSRTGRFISIPVADVDSRKSVINKGIQIDPATVSVSDTWVLKQDGPVSSFEQQKSLTPPPVYQSGKVVIQDSSVIQLDGSPNGQIVSQIGYSKNPTVVGKGLNAPLDIWPVRNDLGSSKALEKSVPVDSKGVPYSSPKSGSFVVSNLYPPPPPPPALPQKSVVNSKFPPQFYPPAVPLVNGKPCPIPPQKNQFPLNPNLLSVPLGRVVTTQSKLPLTRIVRVNRYPSGSYYILNRRFLPNAPTYPSSLIQQPKTQLVRLIQTRQFPVPVQSKQPILPAVQTKQLSIPVQTQVVSQKPTRLVAVSLPTQQIIAPGIYPKSPSRLLYPAVQAIRYAYPWNRYLQSLPAPGKSVIVPQSSPLKVKSRKLSSDSSSSESSSSEDSSSEEKVKKPKKDKVKKEEIIESGEKGKEVEIEKEAEKEPEVKSAELEKESEEIESETQSKESIEAAESQAAYQVQKNSEISVPKSLDVDGVYRIAPLVANDDRFRVNIQSDEPENVTNESAHGNFISNRVTDIKM